MSIIQHSKVAGVHVHIYTYKKQNQLQSLFWVVSMTSVHLRDVAERCYGPFSHRTCTQLPVFARISILLGLGTPSIVPLLCAISPLSRQGAKTRTRSMANSDAIAKFLNNYVRTRYKYSWDHCICGVALFRKWVECCDRSFYIWGCYNRWSLYSRFYGILQPVIKCEYINVCLCVMWMCYTEQPNVQYVLVDRLVHACKTEGRRGTGYSKVLALNQYTIETLCACVTNKIFTCSAVGRNSRRVTVTLINISRYQLLPLSFSTRHHTLQPILTHSSQNCIQKELAEDSTFFLKHNFPLNPYLIHIQCTNVMQLQSSGGGSWGCWVATEDSYQLGHVPQPFMRHQNMWRQGLRRNSCQGSSPQHSLLIGMEGTLLVWKREVGGSAVHPASLLQQVSLDQLHTQSSG